MFYFSDLNNFTIVSFSHLNVFFLYCTLFGALAPSVFSQKSEGSKGSLNFRRHENMYGDALVVTLAVFGRYV